jgi:hypothetical protein
LRPITPKRERGVPAELAAEKGRHLKNKGSMSVKLDREKEKGERCK